MKDSLFDKFVAIKKLLDGYKVANANQLSEPRPYSLIRHNDGNIVVVNCKGLEIPLADWLEFTWMNGWYIYKEVER